MQPRIIPCVVPACTVHGTPVDLSLGVLLADVHTRGSLARVHFAPLPRTGAHFVYSRNGQASHESENETL
jgi:hypothetical protein